MLSIFQEKCRVFYSCPDLNYGRYTKKPLPVLTKLPYAFHLVNTEGNYSKSEGQQFNCLDGPFHLLQQLTHHWTVKYMAITNNSSTVCFFILL